MPISPLDTYDYTPIEVDLGNLLSVGETITTASVAVPSTAAAAGVSVDTTTNIPTVIDGPTTGATSAGVRFWPKVDVGSQEDGVFKDPGLEVAFGVRFTTSTGRQLERHVPITFIQNLEAVEA